MSLSRQLSIHPAGSGDGNGGLQVHSGYQDGTVSFPKWGLGGATTPLSRRRTQAQGGRRGPAEAGARKGKCPPPGFLDLTAQRRPARALPSDRRPEAACVAVWAWRRPTGRPGCVFFQAKVWPQGGTREALVAASASVTSPRAARGDPGWVGRASWLWSGWGLEPTQFSEGRGCPQPALGGKAQGSSCTGPCL